MLPLNQVEFGQTYKTHIEFCGPIWDKKSTLNPYLEKKSFFFFLIIWLVCVVVDPLCDVKMFEVSRAFGKMGYFFRLIHIVPVRYHKSLTSLYSPGQKHDLELGRMDLVFLAGANRFVHAYLWTSLLRLC